MSSFIKSLFVLSICCYSFTLSAQDCSALEIVSEGQVMTYGSFNAKDKEVRSHTTTILSKESSNGGVAIGIEVAYYDKKDGFIQKSGANYTCDGGTISLDMMTNFPGNMDTYANMEIEVIQNENFLPANPTVGANLDDAIFKVNITMEGNQPFGGIDAIYSNRKVLSKETLTTPAGSFECYKIQSEYEIIIKTLGIGLPDRGSSTDYFSPSIGMIKTESYNKKGKMTGYTLLTELKK